MKAKLVFLAILLCAGAYLLLRIGAQQQPQDVWQGYVEGESVLIAPLDTATIMKVDVRRGDSVTPGQVLFSMDDTEAAHTVAEAQARLARAEAQLRDLMHGQRPEELDVRQSAIDDAQAGVQLTLEQYNRQKALLADGLVTASAADSAKAAYDQALAKLAAAKKELVVAALPARADAVAAAEQAREEAVAALAEAQWHLDRGTVHAAVSGVVDDVIRRAGENASPQQPVLSILPPDNRLIRFFVPEADLHRFKPGQNVGFSCTGCAADLRATVSYVAPRAEYTPPVIYSVQSREKLVFMIEARPVGDPARFTPGQPVDIRPAP